MKMNKKITAMILSAVIAAAPVAAPVMEVQTVAAATTTTKTLKNTWSKDGRYYSGRKNRSAEKDIDDHSLQLPGQSGKV